MFVCNSSKIVFDPVKRSTNRITSVKIKYVNFIYYAFALKSKRGTKDILNFYLFNGKLFFLHMDYKKKVSRNKLTNN